MWGDMGYQGKDLKDHIKREYDIEIEIVKRPPSRFWVHKDTPPELLPKVEPGFKVQPRRFLCIQIWQFWFVEREVSISSSLLSELFCNRVIVTTSLMAHAGNDVFCIQ
ncbi:transposase [Trichonephila clavata]|uniref:Transposase n=1 Tax=Trichonephila clavata TaxID=2740835 RepID=A0A8X6LN25_TRICU|nr:transposase [Trichonephila clavata]GFR33793.1 transposase [Trichonephila clavata]